ncbi:MAG: hypothetical protein Q9165_001031 [Trypethelium subeluteriae]
MDDDGSSSPTRTNWSTFARNRSASMSTFASLRGSMPSLEPTSFSTTTTTTTTTTNRTSSPPPSTSISTTTNSTSKRLRHPPHRNPTLDLRALELLHPCDPNLICPICHSPFVEPTQLSCEHIFCGSCIAQTWAAQAGRLKSCPQCRARVGTGNVLPNGRGVSRVVVAMLEELRVRCPYAGRGGRGRGRGRDWLAGEEEEEEEEDGCGSVVARGEVRDHVERYSKREELEKHRRACPLATLAPFLEAQKRRQDELQASHDLLQRKYNLLEGGLNSIQDMLYSTPTAAGTHDREGPSTENHIQTSDAASSQIDIPGEHSTDSNLHTTSSDPTAPLLSLIESLREDIARVSASVADLDSRHSMMITNDGLRAREDMAYANAAINGLRVQLHWLRAERQQLRPLVQALDLGL